MFNALGIIAYNNTNVYVEGLEKYRPIAAFNFIGRYRLVDFPISNMTNSGMFDIDVYVNGNPKVLFEHIGSGRPPWAGAGFPGWNAGGCRSGCGNVL